MADAIVNKIIPFSSVDGPGNRTAVFLQGCGFNCKYCHNPETIRTCINCAKCVNFCKSKALSFENGKVVYDSSKCIMCDECIRNCENLSSPKTCVMSPVEVMQRVKKNMPFIRGLTVSGGECTTYRDFLCELLALAKSEGLDTMLDSNGSYPFMNDERLLSVTDGVMLDVKAWDDEEHVNLTSSHNEMVKKNLEFLLKAGKLFEVRTVVVPDLFDAKDTVDKVSKMVSACSSNVRYKIIKYRDMGVRPEYKNIEPPTDEFLYELKKVAADNGLTDIVLI